MQSQRRYKQQQQLLQYRTNEAARRPNHITLVAPPRKTHRTPSVRSRLRYRGTRNHSIPKPDQTGPVPRLIISRVWLLIILSGLTPPASYRTMPSYARGNLFRMQFKAGFPPKGVSGSETDSVVQLGITSGSAVTVLERKGSPAPTSSAVAAASATVETSVAAAERLTSRLPPPPPASATPPPASGTPAAPPPASTPSPNPPSQSPAQSSAMVQSLVDMGFPEGFAARALEAAGGDINTALEMCMGGDPAAFFSDGAGGVGEERALRRSWCWWSGSGFCNMQAFWVKILVHS